MNNNLDDLLCEAVAWAKNKRAHPYAADLIEVLRPHGNRGLIRRRVIDSLERNRRAKELPIPTRFEEVVQSIFNLHCVDSAVYMTRGTPLDALFSSRREGRNAVWVVDLERADAWLRTRNIPFNPATPSVAETGTRIQGDSAASQRYIGLH